MTTKDKPKVKEEKQPLKKKVAGMGIIMYTDDTYETRISGVLTDKMINFFITRLLKAWSVEKGKRRRDERKVMLEEKRKLQELEEKNNARS